MSVLQKQESLDNQSFRKLKTTEPTISNYYHDMNCKKKKYILAGQRVDLVKSQQIDQDRVTRLICNSPNSFEKKTGEQISKVANISAEPDSHAPGRRGLAN